MWRQRVTRGSGGRAAHTMERLAARAGCYVAKNRTPAQPSRGPMNNSRYHLCFPSSAGVRFSRGAVSGLQTAKNSTRANREKRYVHPLKRVSNRYPARGTICPPGRTKHRLCRCVSSLPDSVPPVKVSRDRSGSVASQTARSCVYHNKLTLSVTPFSSVGCCPRVFGAEKCTSFVYNSISPRARAQ